MQITRDDLIHIAPRPKNEAQAAVWERYVGALTSPEGISLMSRYGVSTRLRVCHALAQWAGAETGGFRVLWESGAYTAAGILRVFGAGRHSAAVREDEAIHIASLPVNPDGSGPRCDALFERVYGTGNPRMARQLGNVAYGDGPKFRGLGFNQLTGREAHERTARKIGCPVERLSDPLNLLHAALVEWTEKDCNRYADLDDCVSIRKLINAGSLKVPLSRINGLAETQAALRRAKAAITEEDFRDDDAPMPDVPKPIVVATEADPASASTVATANDLARTSRKVSILMQLRTLAMGFGAGGTGLSFVDIANQSSALHSIAQLFRDNAFLILICGCVVGFLVAQYLIRLCVDDYNSGRYVPSKQEE